MAASTPELPAPELDTREQGAARANVSKRSFIRFEEWGMPGVITGRIKRYDRALYMPWIRGERPAPEPVRRGRPRKREEGATASPTAATGTPWRPKLRLRATTPETAAAPPRPKLRLRHHARGSL
jgi:hypothetical protein